MRKINNSLKTFIAGFFVLALIFSNFFMLPRKAQALSTGEAVGKAVAAGVACFAEQQGEDFLFGIFARTEAIPEGNSMILQYPVSVPAIDAGAVAVSKSTETSNALANSKDCIRDVLAKILLDWIVDETINWIQGNGEPGYVQNWDKFGSDAFNAGIGEVINDSNLKFLCSPFKMPLISMFLPVPRFQQQISCTLDQIVGNIDAFYEDFSQGGWIAYDTMWLPQNNFYGAFMMASDEAVIAANNKQTAALNEAMAGKGYLSSKRCLQKEDIDVTACQTCGGDSQCYSDCVSALNASAKCVKEEIVSPASLTGDLVSSAMTSDAQWAANIKSWVAALTNAVLSRLTEEGLGMMKKSTDSNSSSGDFDPWGTYGGSKQSQDQNLLTMISHAEDILADMEEIRTNKMSSASSTQATLTILRDMRNNNCQPPVANSEITTTETSVTELNTTVSNLNSFMPQINSFISGANNYIATDTASVTTFNNLETQYENIVVQSSSFGTVQQSVSEANSKQSTYTSAQQRSSSCNMSISL